MSAVPVIDLTAWFHGDENDRRQAAARVDDAVSAGPLDRRPVALEPPSSTATRPQRP